MTKVDINLRSGLLALYNILTSPNHNGINIVVKSRGSSRRSIDIVQNKQISHMYIHVSSHAFYHYKGIINVFDHKTKEEKVAIFNMVHNPLGDKVEGLQIHIYLLNDITTAKNHTVMAARPGEHVFGPLSGSFHDLKTLNILKTSSRSRSTTRSRKSLKENKVNQ